jgi:hypothetical protein
MSDEPEMIDAEAEAEAEALARAQAAEAEAAEARELAANTSAVRAMIAHGLDKEALALAKPWPDLERWAKDAIARRDFFSSTAQPSAAQASGFAEELGAAIARKEAKPERGLWRRLEALPENTSKAEAKKAAPPDLELKAERAEPDAQLEAESKAEEQPKGKPRPDWATADWDEPVKPKAAEEQSEARLVPPELGKLVARAEPRQPVSYFLYTRTPSGIVPSFENALIAVKAMKLDCRLDVFHDRVIVKGYESTASGDAAENLDNTLMKLREKILRQWGFDPGKEYLADAVRTECLDTCSIPSVTTSTGFGGMASPGSTLG